MKRTRLLALLTFCLPTALVWAGTPTAPKLLAGFQPNLGQFTSENGTPLPDVRFVGDAPGMRLYLRATGVSYVFQETPTPLVPLAHPDDNLQELSTTRYRLDLNLVGANLNPTAEGAEPLPGHYNYYLAHAPEGILNVPRFAAVTYRDVYPGVDLAWRNTDQGTKYEFILQPGADPTSVQLQPQGASFVEVTTEGHFRMETPLGTVEEAAPTTYWLDAAGRQHPVPSAFKWDGNVLSFEVGDYPAGKTLVIDPMVQAWGTYFGTSSSERLYDMAVDQDGDLMVTGHTSSTTGLASGAGVFSSNGAGSNDIFVAAFDSTAGALQWATYYGGTGSDNAVGIAVDGNNDVIVGAYVASSTASFPVTVTTSPGSGNDIAVIKFNDADGSRIWATKYGGSGTDWVRDLAVSPTNGAITVVGYTGSSSTPFPTTGGAFQATLGGGNDGFLLTLRSNGTVFWASFLGGTNSDGLYSVAVNSANEVYVAGESASESNTYPSVTGQFTTAGAFQPSKPPLFNTFGIPLQSGTLAKFSGTGTQLWGTYIGGSTASGGSTSGDVIFELTLDASGNLVLLGQSCTSNFPVSGGAFDATISGQCDHVIGQFTPGGAQSWTTFLGGSGNEGTAGQVVVDGTGTIHYTGETFSTNFCSSYPGLCTDGFSSSNSGSNDAIYVQIDPTGTPQSGSYLGGSSQEFGEGIAVDPTTGDIFLSGWTNSTNFPTTAGASQPTHGGSWDGFITRVTPAIILPISALQLTVEAVSEESVALRLDATGTTPGVVLALEYAAEGSAFRAAAAAEHTTEPGQSLYRFSAAQATNGPQRFRVRATDLDGTVAFSNVVEVLPGAATALELYPNPVAAGQAFHVGVVGDAPAEVSIYDALGRLQLSVPLPASGQIVAPQLSAGTYTIQATQNGQRYWQRLLVR